MAEYIERTEELVLAMNAGARAIENTKRYHGVVYTKGLFSENPKAIPYLRAVKVLREASDAPAADVAPVVHAQWIEDGSGIIICPECKRGYNLHAKYTHYCPNCGAKMDGGADHDTN